MSDDPAKWFDASPSACMVLDRDLRYIAANQAYLTLTGTTLERVLGRSVFELFPNDPDDPMNEPRLLLEASLQKVLRTRERDAVAYLPYRVARAPGAEPELRIWSATHVPIFDDRGEVVAVLQQTEDVTHLQREDAGRVLSRAEEVQRDAVELGDRLRGLVTTLDQAPGFMAMLRGPEHVFAFSNRAYDSLVGGRKVSGLPIREALPELAGQGFYELLDRVYAAKQPFLGRAMRVQLHQPSGERVDAYVDFVYQPILGPDGGSYGVLVQGHDISEQVRTALRNEFRTRASEQLAAAGDDLEAALVEVAWAAVDTVADWALVDLFEDGRSRRLVAAHADPAHAGDALEMMRYAVPEKPHAAHPLHGLDRTPRVTSTFTPEMLAASAQGPDHHALVQRLGTTSLLTVPLWHRGRLYGVLVLMTAQSRRRYDASDVVPMAELGAVLATAFDNTRLAREREQARQRAEAASRAKDDFLALLGHEMRNPLAPILTAVQLLRRRGTGGERELGIIERQARHLVRLVDDMLDVSRIVHGKIELRRAPVRVADFVEKAVEIATTAIEEKGHELVVEHPPHVLVFGDEARLAQVVANLLTNAARYTPRGGHVAVRASVEGTEVVLRVRDDGIGMEPAMLATIFDMFVQAPQTTERSEGGLGLGLTLVDRLVRMHGGTVSAASDGTGRGSELTVRLPVHVEAASSAAAGPLASAGEVVCHRILVVDDNVDAATLLADLLGAAGHDAFVCHHGLEALDRMLEELPDVAIVDIGLPGIDGFELATRVRDALGAAAPRLIALTGYGGAEDRARSARAGFETHLTKPIDPETLLRLLGP